MYHRYTTSKECPTCGTKPRNRYSDPACDCRRLIRLLECCGSVGEAAQEEARRLVEAGRKFYPSITYHLEPPITGEDGKQYIADGRKWDRKKGWLPQPYGKRHEQARARLAKLAAQTNYASEYRQWAENADEVYAQLRTEAFEQREEDDRGAFDHFKPDWNAERWSAELAARVGPMPRKVAA